MSAQDHGGSAFPEVTTTYTRDGAAEVQYVHSEGGMTLRDYFAAKAMQGMQSNFGANDWTATKFAQRAYEQADAMLRARG